MTELYHRPTIQELIPKLHSTVFEGHESARFAVGRIAEGDDILYPEENRAYHQLRANVYGREGFITPDAIDEAGNGEYDNDDARSIHMAVLENRGDTQYLIASMRLIMRNDDQPLPIEELYPEVFSDNPAPQASCEVSRYIKCHEDPSVTKVASWALYKQAITEAMTRRLSPAFAVIAPTLNRIFRSGNLPVTKLAEPVWIDKYGESNMPVSIDIAKLAARVEDERSMPGELKEMAAIQGGFTYFGERKKPKVDVVFLGETALGGARAKKYTSS